MTTATSTLRKEDTKEVTMRNRSLHYPPLKDFNTKSCSVVNIEMPDFDTALVHEVRFTHEKASYRYHAKEPKQIVQFKAVYMPLDNDAGRKLIPQAKELVEEVLKDDYESETATIIQKGKGGDKPVVEKRIDECVITGTDIAIDVGDYVRITFHLEGIMPEKEGK